MDEKHRHKIRYVGGYNSRIRKKHNLTVKKNYPSMSELCVGLETYKATQRDLNSLIWLGG